MNPFASQKIKQRTEISIVTHEVTVVRFLGDEETDACTQCSEIVGKLVEPPAADTEQTQEEL